MDLRYTPEDERFREHVRSWLKENLPAERPETLGAASRIRGITPAALSAILLHLRRRAA